MNFQKPYQLGFYFSFISNFKKFNYLSLLLFENADDKPKNAEPTPKKTTAVLASFSMKLTIEKT